MKKLFGVLAVSISMLVILSAPAVFAQAPAPGQAPAGKVFQGELTKVDSAARSLSVKGTNGQEMTFSYTDQTQVNNPEKNVQGLAGKAGTELKVTYSEQGGKSVATAIEIIEKKP